jgi:hypothetical protein
MGKMELPGSFADLLVMLAGGRGKRQWLTKELGRDYWQISYWHRANTIPDEYWDDVIALAARQNMDWVTETYLLNLKKRKWKERKEA